MRKIIILTLTWAVPAVAAPPGAPPVNIITRTAGDLALVCSAKPVSASNVAMTNFCNGFAQGVLQMERLTPGGSKICMPTPAPKRSATMAEFVTWVKADAARQKEGGGEGFIHFMTDRYPCKKE
jgi:hypothetical protein